MRKRFLHTLAVVAVVQFAVTRTLAGHVLEEGRAERMWMMYPANVLLNAVAWTLLISAGGRVARIFGRAS